MPPAPKSLMGNRYGRLVVVAEAERAVGANGRVRTAWHVLCDCGERLVVRSTQLQSGRTRSCGCLRGGHPVFDGTNSVLAGERLPPKFLARFTVSSRSGCWEWNGSICSGGYGTFYADQQTHMAHRYAYTLLVGPIPDGLVLDHLCRTRRCVNPTHLEAVTEQTNQHRGLGFSGVQFRAEGCVNGHEWTPANTVTYVRQDGGRRRHCRACWRERSRMRRETCPSERQADGGEG